MRCAATQIILPFLVFAVCAPADDWTTTSGKTYQRVEVLAANPAGLEIRHVSGVSRVGFRDLPKLIQDKFNYDPAKEQVFLRSEQQRLALEQRRASCRRLVRREEKQIEITARIGEDAIAVPYWYESIPSGGSSSVRGAAAAHRFIQEQSSSSRKRRIEGEPIYVVGLPANVAVSSSWSGALFTSGQITTARPDGKIGPLNCLALTADHALAILVGEYYAGQWGPYLKRQHDLGRYRGYRHPELWARDLIVSKKDPAAENPLVGAATALVAGAFRDCEKMDFTAAQPA